MDLRLDTSNIRMEFCKNIAEQIGLDVCHGWWLGGWWWLVVGGWLVLGQGQQTGDGSGQREGHLAIDHNSHPPLRVRLSVLKLEPFQQ